MNVYLDNNILVSLEDNEIDISELNSISKKYFYMYSYAHIQELMEAKDSFSNLKKNRFKTIQELTKNMYLFPDNDNINLKEESPEKVLSTLRMFSGLTNLFKQSVRDFNIDRTRFIRVLNIDSKRINSYTPSEVTEYIDNALRSNLFLTLNTLLDLSGTTLRERISTLFNVLDFVGFWKDKKTEKSNLARTYDSSHTYFASYCNLFVSNDKRARYKAKVAYEYNNIETKVLSFEDFKKMNK